MEEVILQNKKNALFKNLYRALLINGTDGVIIVFFITTGLSSANASTNIILGTGIGAIILFALFMSASAYIAGKKEKKHFNLLLNKEFQDEEDLKEKRLLENLGIGIQIQKLAQEEIEKDRENWKNILVKLEYANSKTTTNSVFKNSALSGLSYIIGGIIPLTAYLFTTDIQTALQYSSIVSLTTLFVLGYFKSLILKQHLLGGAVYAVILGALAGLASFFIARHFY
ncbi:MAG: VIT1/CCC1 transporter family protein [Ginsengibacter sp.]